MSRLDRVMDPVTGDLQSAAAGAWRVDDVLLNKLIMSYTIDRGTFEGDPEMGHRFAELNRATNSEDTRRRLADLVVDAVQWLIDSGELSKVEVDVQPYTSESLAFVAKHYPADDGEAFKIGPFFVPLGG
jgi:phage gp46-like protein